MSDSNLALLKTEMELTLKFFELESEHKRMVEERNKIVAKLDNEISIKYNDLIGKKLLIKVIRTEIRKFDKTTPIKI